MSTLLYILFGSNKIKRAATCVMTPLLLVKNKAKKEKMLRTQRKILVPRPLVAIASQTLSNPPNLGATLLLNLKYHNQTETQNNYINIYHKEIKLHNSC